MIKWASPSPHGFIEMIFAMPVIAFGCALMSVGLFLLRNRVTLIVGVLAAVITVGALTPIIFILLAIAGMDLDEPPSLIYYPLRLSNVLTMKVVDPFIDSFPDDPALTGAVYALEPRLGAQGKAFLDDSLISRFAMTGYAPVQAAEINLWEEADYRCYQELRELGACAGAVPHPRDSARSDSEGRFTLIYPLDLFREITPKAIHARAANCQSIAARMPDLTENPKDHLITLLLVCADKGMKVNDSTSGIQGIKTVLELG